MLSDFTDVREHSQVPAQLQQSAASQIGRSNADAARIAELEAFKQQSLRESAALTRSQELHHTTISALATQAEFQAMRSAVQCVVKGILKMFNSELYSYMNCYKYGQI